MSSHFYSFPFTGPKKNPKIPSWFIYGVIELLLTTIISTLLILTTHKNKTFANPFYNFVVNYRATIQTIVQLVSHLLGLVHIFIITKVFNFITRKRFQKGAVSLNCLSWWDSMCSRRFDTSLPFRFLLLVSLFIGRSHQAVYFIIPEKCLLRTRALGPACSDLGRGNHSYYNVANTDAACRYSSIWSRPSV